MMFSAVFTTLPVLGVLVLCSKNPVHSVLFLVLVFFNATALLLLLGIDFLAMLFLVVYVGAVAVLFLFVVMMLNLKIEGFRQSLLNYYPISAIVLVLLVVFSYCVVTDAGMPPKVAAFIWSEIFEQPSSLVLFGYQLYTYQFVALGLASAVLLVAMVGSILLTFLASVRVVGGERRQNIYRQVIRSVDVRFGLMKVFGFQSSISPIMEGIVDLHNHIFYFLVLIFVFVFWLFANIIYNFFWALTVNRDSIFLRHMRHSTALEVIWTIIPSLILVAIAVPSFALLYAMDEVLEPTLTLKAVGHQWYWNYQYSNCVPAPFVAGLHPELVPNSVWDTLNDEAVVDLAKLVSLPASSTLIFDSYMLTENDLSSGSYRLLEVDEPLVLPAHVQVRLLVTAEDVIHSFALPQLGVKVDAIPGRLNQQGFFIKRLGVFYGQCSELCGVNHGFMPIVVQAVTLGDFSQWYLTKLDMQYHLGWLPFGR